jgi:hypothetical protein
VVYEVFVDHDGFGAGLRSRRAMFLTIWAIGKPRNNVIDTVSAPSGGQHVVFLKGRLANTAWGIFFAGSGAREPDSPWKSIARGGEERAKAEKIGFESPCTTFGKTSGLRNLLFYEVS